MINYTNYRNILENLDIIYDIAQDKEKDSLIAIQLFAIEEDINQNLTKLMDAIKIYDKKVKAYDEIVKQYCDPEIKLYTAMKISGIEENDEIND